MERSVCLIRMKKNMGHLRASALLAFAVMGLAISGCARTPQQKYARFMEIGKKLMVKKDYARAALEFKNAIQAMPKDPEAHYQLALAYLDRKDYRSGIAELRKATELDPKHKAAQLALADLMTTSSDKEILEEAEQRLQQVLASSPSDPDALNTLAVAEARLGRPEEAEEYLQQAFEHAPQNLKSSFNLVKVKLAQKNTAAAEGILKKVVDASPGKVEPLMALGAFYAVAGHPESAEQQFRRILQIDPKNGSALLALGGIKVRAGRMDEAEQLYKQASALPDPQYKPVHAILLFQSGKRDQAVAELETLAKQDPSDRTVRTALVDAYQAVNKLPEADKILSAVLQKNPKDVDALLQRSRFYLRVGKYKEAESDLANVLHFQPDSGRAHYLMAKVHQKKKAALSQQQELAAALRWDPNLLPARIELAQLLTSSNGAQSALSVLDDAPVLQKNSLPILIQKNWSRLVLNDRAEAHRGIDLALALARNPETLVQDAVLKLEQRDFHGAQRSLEEALKLNPEDLRALDLLAQSYGSQKQAALEKVREYARQRPKSAPLQHLLGRWLLATGDLSGARDAFTAAKQADPGFTAADLSLAQVDFSSGKLDEARKRLSAFVVSNPSDVQAILMLGGVEASSGSFSAALERYRKVVDLDDRNIAALNNLAYLLGEQANSADEALKFAEKAKELAPDNPAVQDTLGWVLYRKGLFTMAVRYLEQAVSREPTGLRKGHLAMAYFKSGDRKRGQEMMNAAMRMDPKLPASGLYHELLAETGGQAR
jgi:tetratricopeptide (TPR) repeat protein